MIQKIKNREYYKISHTALLVAGFRARYTDMPYAQEIYQTSKSLGEKSLLERIAPFLGWLAKFFPGSLERLASLEGRYLATNEALKKLGKDVSIIEIASGLSARSLEWASQNNPYVETDLPDMIRIKQEIFAEITKEKSIETNQNHHFYPLDATKPREWMTLGKKYFAKKPRKIAIIHEGLIAYLTREEQERIRDNIASFLRIYSPKGAWITTDFSTPKRKESPLVGFAKRMIKRNTQREFNHFTDSKEVIQFLQKGGLEAEILDNSHILKKMTCIGKSKMDISKVRADSSNYKAYYITLKR